MKRLEGKHAVVTGAGSGIGRATAVQELAGINGQAIAVDGGLTSSLSYAPSNALRVPR